LGCRLLREGAVLGTIRGEHGVEIERGIDRAQNFFERLQFADRAGQLAASGRSNWSAPLPIRR